MSARPRFPWGPALLSAACCAMAAWIWLQYSCTWDVTPAEIQSGACTDCWVRVRASAGDMWIFHSDDAGFFHPLAQTTDGGPCVCVRRPRGGRPAEARKAREYVGRVVPLSRFGFDRKWLPPGIEMAEAPLAIDGWGPRVLPQCIAGLVVAAFGTFVFALYLRRWLLERKALGPRETGDA